LIPAAVEETCVVAASAERVWRAVTDREERARWWRDLDLEAAPGARVLERWTGDDGTPQFTHGEVVCVVEGRLLGWRWTDAGWPAATEVELMLDEAAGATFVTVREYGWQRLPDGTRLAEQHSAGWRMHLQHLCRHVQT
jgi:uncharacterized protein YndB with AHSA1/START domain